MKSDADGFPVPENDAELWNESVLTYLAWLLEYNWPLEFREWPRREEYDAWKRQRSTL